MFDIVFCISDSTEHDMTIYGTLDFYKQVDLASNSPIASNNDMHSWPTINVHANDS